MIFYSWLVLFVVCILLYVSSNTCTVCVMVFVYMIVYSYNIIAKGTHLCSWLYTGTSILTTIIFVESKLDIKVSFLFGAFTYAHYIMQLLGQSWLFEVMQYF